MSWCDYGVTQWAYAGAAEGAGVPTVKSETRMMPGVTTSIITYAYWSTGTRRSMVVTNAATQVYAQDYTYDDADRITNLIVICNSKVVNYPYTYKPNWDLVASVKGVCTSGAYQQAFTYDSLGRRCTVTSLIQGATLSTRTYGYDTSGQRISQSIEPPPIRWTAKPHL